AAPEEDEPDPGRDESGPDRRRRCQVGEEVRRDSAGSDGESEEDLAAPVGLQGLWSMGEALAQLPHHPDSRGAQEQPAEDGWACCQQVHTKTLPPPCLASPSRRRTGVDMGARRATPPPRQARTEPRRETRTSGRGPAAPDGRTGPLRDGQRTCSPDEPGDAVFGIDRLLGRDVDLDGRLADSLLPEVGEAHREAMPARAGGEELRAVPAGVSDGDAIDLNGGGLLAQLAEPSTGREP